VIEIGDLVRLDWEEGYKRLGLGIVVKQYRNDDTPVLVWWMKAEAHGWEDTEMLIKVEGQ
jgi:hypothetical protein